MLSTAFAQPTRVLCTAMTGVNVTEISDSARSAWTDLRDDLRLILKDDLIAMWAHGGATSVADPVHVGDLDTYVIVSRQPDEPTVGTVEATEDRVAREHGIEWDNWYVRAGDAAGTEPPRHAWRQERRDTSWALHRAHWLAGRYVALHGAEPDGIVKPPSWDELQGELSRELEHIERHVIEGDTDPYEATYALLNGSRILHAVETRKVALSKRAAGVWALEHLPASWHPGLEAALRSYDGQVGDGDIDLLATAMAPFVALVRERLPYPGDRPSDAPPRWSGS